MNFEEHKEQTAKDCESVAETLTNLAAKIRQGNLKEFEKFWIEGGTEEGDSKLVAIWDNIVLRYSYREENLDK